MSMIQFDFRATCLFLLLCFPYLKTPYKTKHWSNCLTHWNMLQSRYSYI